MSESLLSIFVYLLDNTEKWKKTDDFFCIIQDNEKKKPQIKQIFFIFSSRPFACLRGLFSS
jgi:hypothetical protein